MAFKISEDIRKVLINTGNILSLNDITKKPGQNPTEELIEALNITLTDFQNGGSVHPHPEQPVVITRRHDDLASKMAEQELSELKIGLKIFLNSDDNVFLKDALDKAFSALNVSSVHNVIIAYNNKKEGQVDDDSIDEIQNIWKTLEHFAENKKILQIGISDIEESTFRILYDWSKIKPSIIQINLTTCCVVPPTLQTFCKDNDVQLLTHSDPTDIFPEDKLENIFGMVLKLNWVLRFLVHIKCRGVLATKGYIIAISK